MAEQPDADVSTLPPLTNQDRVALAKLGLGETLNYDTTQTLVDLFTEQVRKTPDNTCVVFQNKHLTFREVDAMTDRLAILLQNRHFYVPQGLAFEAREYILSEFLTDCSGYDIIKGWRADDSYFSFAKAFLNGSISLEQLSSAMKLGQLGEQIVLKSEKAFGRIHYLGASPAPDVYAARRKARDEAAREDFSRLKASAEPLAGTYILDILRNKWKNDDERLR